MINKDNKGVSLVEILISVVILAIVLIPINHSFVSSYKVNVKSRQTLRATTLAQNEMEIFEKEKIIDLEDESKFQYKVEKNSPGEGCITFSREGVVNDNSGREMFDVVVTLNPEDYSVANSEEIKTINTLSVNDSGRYVQTVKTENNKKDQDSLKYKEFVKIAKNNETLEYFEENVKREIYLDLSTKKVNGFKADGTKVKADATIAKVRYEYTAPLGSVPTGKEKLILEKTIFDNSSTMDENGKLLEMKSAYLFYAPRYKAKSDAVGNKDFITINNPKNVPIDIYIIRQNLKDSDPTLENNYQAQLTINEKKHIKARYHTNLKINDTLGNTAVGKKVSLYLGTKAILSPNKRDEILSDITNDIKKNRIYSMEVKVYKKGADKATEAPYISLTGTKME